MSLKQRKELAAKWRSKRILSERKACKLISLSRSQLNYQSQKNEDPKLIKALLEVKEQRPYFGRPRLLATLRRKGFAVNEKKVHRLMKVLRLNVARPKRRKSYFKHAEKPRPIPFEAGKVWAMDFVFDRLKNGTPFRCLNIIDTFTREVPGILVSSSMAGFTPVDYLEKLKSTTSLPEHFILDNGTEFANYTFMKWCKDNNISVHFIDPGKPVQNAFIESFNGKFRKEFLDQQIFYDLQSVRHHLKEWLTFYNEERPHSSLDYLTPKEFARDQKTVLNIAS